MARLASILSIIVGVAFIISGAVAWGVVSSQLAEENITVPDDAPFAQGDQVDGPISAYAQAEIIKEHALEGSEGRTYAELGSLVREAESAGDTELAEEYQAQRDSNMNGSFLRASLFTSVLAYGVSAMAIATGLSLALLGAALLRRDKRRDAVADTRHADAGTVRTTHDGTVEGGSVRHS